MFSVNPKGETTDFFCSGFAFEKVAGGYLFATAEHCLEDQMEIVVSFSPDEKGPYIPTETLAISDTDDVAILMVHTSEKLNIVPVLDEQLSKPGTSIADISYILDSGKLVYFGELIQNRFEHISIVNTEKRWTRTMPVNVPVAEGASGSPILDLKRKGVIGIMVGGYGGRLSDVDIAVQASQLIKLRKTLTKY